MRVVNNPPKSTWEELTKRPSLEKQVLTENVSEILKDVQRNGDSAIYRYTQLLDGVQLNSILVDETEFEDAREKVPLKLKESMRLAYANIEKFHKSQQIVEPVVETMQGVRCWRKSVGIEKVGLYIPGGSAPLFSTVLMLGIPAKLAGCKEIVLCTPPSKEGKINPAILFAAELVGIKTIFKIGGAQAIAAMGFGTESVPKLDKIFGPGNQYVTKAKELIQQSGTAIDMPAGPSEVLIIADETSNPIYVAADLLSQAEHGADSQVILVSNCQSIIEKSIEQVQVQLTKLPRKNIAEQALDKSRAIVFDEMKDCIAFSNSYAPEHLILASESFNEYVEQIENAGSVFLGNYSCESAGDYASGTNHTLPTNGFAKSYSGVSIDSFVKKITFQELTREGIQSLGPAIEIMAEAEELFAHKNAVTVRLKTVSDE
ncbi:MAG: histidinol dehydrogenase [Crocinitomicaceae bacterium]|nr:histidinol dehydrogenase [Crocinitomicaceae bacterium]